MLEAMKVPFEELPNFLKPTINFEGGPTEEIIKPAHCFIEHEMKP